MGKKPTEKITDMVTFADIALTLARDFESVFVIDPKDGNYDEYSISGVENELVVRSSGRDFFADMAVNVNESIYEDDRERLLEALEKRKLLKTLKTSGSFLQRYRLMVKGVPRYHSMKIMETAEGFILIAVLDIDETVRREKERKAERRTYSEVAQSLASLYEVIYHVDVNTGYYRECSSRSSYASLGLKKEGKDFFGLIKRTAKNYISSEDMDRVLKALDRDNLVERLGSSSHIALTFHQIIDGKMQEAGLIAFRHKSDFERIVVGVVNINERTFPKQQGIDYRKFASILAGRYEIIFQINTETDEFIQYSADEEREILEVVRTGKDFFETSDDVIKRMVVPEDRDMVLRALGKEEFLRDLEKYGNKILTFRHMRGKKTRFMTLFAVRSKEDPAFATIAIGYADIVKKLSGDPDLQKDIAADMAGKDELTNVRNKKAYAYIEAELDRLISSKEKPEFALTVCDIDDLKGINERKGRREGDEAIREACDLICSIFEHSAVFRIGGDEFVVVLRDQDYEKRESLISNLLYEREKSRRNGGVTISYGISDYDPETDLRVADVYKRADAAMNENKRQSKKGKRLIGQPEPLLLYRDRPERFGAIFEELVFRMTESNVPNVKKIESLLNRIGDMFRLSRAVTRIYRNADDEKKGEGETLCSFDKHLKDVPVCTVRYVSSVLSIATMTAYMAEGVEPLSDEELEKVKLVMQSVVSYVSRNRMSNLVDRMAFYDDEGYRNTRAFFYQLMETDPSDRAVAYYNIRQFGVINSEYGKKNADIIMKKHYEGLRDIIGNRGAVFRLGGDFFLAFFGQEQIDPVADYLEETDIGLDDSGLRKVPVSTRAGVYIIPVGSSGADGADFVSRSAMAYKTAKEIDDGTVYFYDQKMTHKVEKADKLRKDFPGALERGEFKVYYQPKVDINTGRIVGAESLCRWIKNGKLIPPSDFIELLERTDDICRLDYYMLEQVCRDLRRWLDEGWTCPRVSVNFSRRHMKNTRFDETITQIVDKYDIPRRFIEIELTETTTDVEFSDLKRVVAGLQKVGMYTAVDDFGIGYSSLKLIKDIPWNILKVDKSFLPEHGDLQDENVDIMYRYVVHMTKELGIECVTEGVETVEQVRILRENGCDIAQGFLYDRPLPVAEFETRLDGYKYEIY